jgi:hypothetical protein
MALLYGSEALPETLNLKILSSPLSPNCKIPFEIKMPITLFNLVKLNQGQKHLQAAAIQAESIQTGMKSTLKSHLIKTLPQKVRGEGRASGAHPACKPASPLSQ